jgi:hypothetical protein
LETGIKEMDSAARKNEMIFVEVDLSGCNEAGERKKNNERIHNPTYAGFTRNQVM